ncbi:MAG: hypothetical protein Q4F79_02450 [Eubacteriales bacterium]|nr:hypothetical protein [Eubacteriales bacterium]
MQWNTDLTTQRIDCAAADLIDHLYEAHCPSPCRRSAQEVWDWLHDTYPAEDFPASDPIYARTALSVLELYRPDDAEYLPVDLEERLAAVSMYNRSLQLRCAQITDTAGAAALFAEQKEQFLARTAGYPLTWRPRPIVVCMELTTGYRLVTGSQLLSDELTVRYGVTQEDIDGRSEELLAYLRARHALDHR